MLFFNWNINKEKEEIKDLEDLQFSKVKYIISYTIFLILVFVIIFGYIMIYVPYIDETIIFSFILLFIGILGVQFSFFINDYLKIKKEINRKKIDLENKLIAIKNEISKKQLKKYSASLKYKPDINDKTFLKENQEEILNILITEVRKLINSNIDNNDKNYSLKIIFDWKYNGYNMPKIISLLSKEEIQKLLLYVIDVLKEENYNTWELHIEKNKLKKENEEFFLALKKNLEKRYNEIIKEEKKSNKKRKTINKNKTSKLEIDLDDNIF